MIKEQAYTIETERELDGRWLAEIVELPGVMVYGETEKDAETLVKSLASRVKETDLFKDL